MPGILVLLLLAAKLGCSAAQTAVNPSEVTTDADGSLNLNGTTFLSANLGWFAAYTRSTAGLVYTLAPSEALISPFISGTTCLFVSFGTNWSTVDAFVTTKANLQTMLRGGSLDYSIAQPVANGVWKNTRGAGVGNYVALNFTQTYVFVMINTGGQGADNNGNTFSSSVSYRASLFTPNSQQNVGECGFAATQAAVDGATVSSQAFQNNSLLATYLERDVAMQFKQAAMLAVMDSATCVSFQVLAQASASMPSLDLEVFLSPLVSLGDWISDNYTGPYPYVGSVCQQTTNASATSPAIVNASSSATSTANTNATVSPKQSCQVSIDDLDTSQRYVIWAMNGLRSANGGPANVTIRYSSRGSGGCWWLQFPDTSSSTTVLVGSTSRAIAISTRLSNLTAASATTPSALLTTAGQNTTGGCTLCPESSFGRSCSFCTLSPDNCLLTCADCSQKSSILDLRSFGGTCAITNLGGNLTCTSTICGVPYPRDAVSPALSVPAMAPNIAPSAAVSPAALNDPRSFPCPLTQQQPRAVLPSSGADLTSFTIPFFTCPNFDGVYCLNPSGQTVTGVCPSQQHYCDTNEQGTGIVTRVNTTDAGVLCKYPACKTAQDCAQGLFCDNSAYYKQNCGGGRCSPYMSNSC